MLHFNGLLVALASPRPSNLAQLGSRMSMKSDDPCSLRKAQFQQSKEPQLSGAIFLGCLSSGLHRALVLDTHAAFRSSGRGPGAPIKNTYTTFKFSSQYGVHPRTSKMKRDAGKKKTHRRNQSSLSSHKEFSQRTKDRSMTKRVARSMSGFGHFSMSSHVGRTKNTKEEHRGD